MASASVAGAASRCSTSSADVARRAWDRESIIEAIREWVATYDEPPRAADLNPSSARWSGQTWRVERYRAGRADGSPWPSLNAVKRPFGGSLGAAVRAAGFVPGRPGPRRREVVPPQSARLQMTPDVRVVLDAALAAARDADRRADALRGRLDRATARTATLVAERDAARRRSAGADARARAAVEAAVRQAEGELAELRAAAAVAARAVADARGAATAAEARAAERAREAAALRAERDALRTRLDEAIAEAEALADGARDAVAPPDVLRDARADAAAARRAAAAAEGRAAEAERALRERRTAEGPPDHVVGALRAGAASGPAGPAALGAAVAGLARARRAGAGPAVRAALWDVAVAAVAWRERI